jgi:hypothetical protein
MTTKRSFQDYRLLLWVSLLHLAMAFALRVVSWPTLRRAMPVFRALVIRPLGAVGEVDFLWALEASARRLSPVSSCLVRALVTELVLDSHDDPVRVTVGVRRIAARLEGHAWVERGGRVIVGEVPTNAATSVRSSFVPHFFCQTTIK